MLKKRATILLFCFFIIFSLGIGSFVYTRATPNHAFQNITKELLSENLTGNSLLLHFMVKDCKKAGLDETICMPEYSKENQALQLQRLQSIYEQLCDLDMEKSDLHQRLLYDSLTFYLSHTLQLSEYAYFEEPFSPYSGIQNELPILLTEYSFESKADVDNYLQILTLLPDYLDSLCQYEKEKGEQGMFMSDNQADIVISSLDHFAALTEEEQPLLVTFSTRLLPLVQSGLVTEEEYTYYIEENQRIISTVLMPAYQKTGDALTLLKSGEKTEQCGLGSYENGRQYYELLVASVLGEDVSIPALKNAFTRQLMTDFAELNTLLEANASYFIPLINSQTPSDPLYSLDPETCIEILKEKIAADFPASDENDYPYTLKDVSSAMEAYTNPAYYFTPPIDDPSQNVIYINRSQTPEGITLFTTLAHEGFPGHLYQSVSSAKSLSDANLPSLSGIAYFGGYTEGYATYVEFLSYDYAKEAAAELAGNDDASLYYDYLYYNRSISLNLYSILDILIHYENATVADIRPYLAKIGITQEDDILTIYRYIVSEPATYITYYGGYLKILECKNLAKELWGENYTDMQFHTLLLEMGPQSFESIRKGIRESGLVQ
jgi:uncharacterized protein (DUF885 family)